jgi:small-conductance mechanosensitive channel
MKGAGMSKGKVISIFKASGVLLATVAMVFSAVVFVFSPSSLSPAAIGIIVAIGLLLGFYWLYQEPIKRRLKRR